MSLEEKIKKELLSYASADLVGGKSVPINRLVGNLTSLFQEAVEEIIGEDTPTDNYWSIEANENNLRASQRAKLKEILK